VTKFVSNVIIIAKMAAVEIYVYKKKRQTSAMSITDQKHVTRV